MEEIKDDELGEEFKEDLGEEFRRFKKLRKISRVLQEKKEAERRREERRRERQERARFVAENFLEAEAELGSDNELHDDVVKRVEDDDDEELGEEEQRELLAMIDNNVDIDEDNEERAFKIFLRKVDEQERSGMGCSE